MKSIQELVQEWEDTRNDIKREDYVTTKKLNEKHIEDENQSVVWNREFVKKNNETHQQQVEDYRNAYRTKENNLVQSDKEALAEDNGLSLEEAEVIFSYAYSESHSAGYREVMYTADDIADVVNKIKNLEKSKN